MTTFNLWAFVSPIVAGFSILATSGWRNEMFRRKQRTLEIDHTAQESAKRQRIDQARLPEGRVAVYSRGLPRKIARDLVGYFQIVAVGTFGLNQTERLLLLFFQCGLENLIGSVLIIENNTALRENFFRRIPEIYQDRIIFGFSPAFVGGFSNKPINEVLEYIDQWGRPIAKAGVEVADLHERRTGHAPGQILFLWSLGGSAPTGLPALEVLHRAFRHTQIVGFTSLPEHSWNRGKFAELKEQYERHGVHGWVVSDRLNGDWVNADFCMATMIVGPADAQLHDDQTTQLNNIFTLAFPKAPGGVLVYQYTHATVIGHPFVVEGELLGYSLDMQTAIEKVHMLMRDIEDQKGIYSAQLPIGEQDGSVFDFVIATIGLDERHQRDDLQTLRDSVQAGYELRVNRLRSNGQRATAPGLLFGLANYELLFGSMATTVNSQQPAGQIIALRLVAVHNGAQISDEIVKVPGHLLPPYSRDPLPLGSEDALPSADEEVLRKEHTDGTTSTNTTGEPPASRRGRPPRREAAD